MQEVQAVLLVLRANSVDLEELVVSDPAVSAEADLVEMTKTV